MLVYYYFVTKQLKFYARLFIFFLTGKGDTILNKPYKTHVCPFLIIFLNLNLKITESNDLFLNYLKISVIKL